MTEEATLDDRRRERSFHFDRHTPQYRDQFEAITSEMHGHCPLAWSDTYGGHWVAAGNKEVFELARCPHVSNDNDIGGQRKGYVGITIPRGETSATFRGGMLEMDDPEHREYRTPLNGYLSPAAVQRWVPVVDEVVRACLDEKIEAGRIDVTTWPTSSRPCSPSVCLAYRFATGRSTASLPTRRCTPQRTPPTRIGWQICKSRPRWT